jgi:hypothetical protein
VVAGPRNALNMCSHTLGLKRVRISVEVLSDDEVAFLRVGSKPSTSLLLRDYVAPAQYRDSRAVSSGPQPVILPNANSHKQTGLLYRVHFILLNVDVFCEHRWAIVGLSRHFLAVSGI